MLHRLLFCLTILSLPALVWAQSPLDELTAADLAEGEKIFKVHCARCHGIAGQGGEGSNLVRSKLKYATDDQALIDLLDEGIPGTGMPAIWTLDESASSKRRRCLVIRAVAGIFTRIRAAVPPATSLPDTASVSDRSLRTLATSVASTTCGNR